MAEEIYTWNELEDEFKGADLFLGNGFSINFSGRFSYSSLFEHFLNEIEEDDIKERFRSFDTSNFELIQRDLKNAIHVNELFEINSDSINETYQMLKDGLISTVAELHPSYQDFDSDQLESVSEIILENFADIYTTNYDTLIYHIILKILDWKNEGAKITAYSDYFWGNNSVSNARYKAFTGWQDRNYKRLYYLHGALFIYNRLHYTLKLKKNRAQEELIELIEKQIRNDNVPLFVSEGTHYAKMQSINNNGYLSFCYSKFRECNNRIVFFGFGFSENDQHLIDAINRKPRQIAIGLYTEGKSGDEIEREALSIKSKLERQSVKFYSSQSLF